MVGNDSDKDDALGENGGDCNIHQIGKGVLRQRLEICAVSQEGEENLVHLSSQAFENNNFSKKIQSSLSFRLSKTTAELNQIEQNHYIGLKKLFAHKKKAGRSRSCMLFWYDYEGDRDSGISNPKPWKPTPGKLKQFG
ncbi:hypothetical protein QE152_g27473 [Popillia japonica]|uniref:Uncharacterized protein n=1 Tax=Popillia japonica TaxID=7064 RepID=A0AAW1JSM2_POPJA